MQAIPLMLVYAATCAAALWLASRFVTRIPAPWGVAIALLPLLVTGRAMTTGNHFGPLDLAYSVSPLSAGAAPAVRRSPGDGFLSDVAFQMVPWQAAVRRDLRAGRAPLLNPSILCGDVLLGAAQPAPFHPSTLIGLVLPLATARTFAASAAFLLTALSTYLYLAEVGLPPAAAFLGGAAWMLSIHSLFWVGWPQAQSFAPMPLLFLGLRRIARGTPRGLGISVGTMLLAFLGGHPESAFHAAAVAGAYFLWELLRSPRPKRAAVLGSAALLLTLGLAAPVLLPMIEAVPQTREGQGRLAGQGRTSIAGIAAMRSAAGAAFPDWYGGWLRAPSPSAPSFDSATAASVGGVALALALISAASSRPEKWPLAILAILTLAVAVGTPGPADAVNRLPIFRLALNNRLASVTAFCLAALAAIGFEELMRDTSRRGARRLLFIGALAAAAASLRSYSLARRGIDSALLLRSGAFFGFGIALMVVLRLACRRDRVFASAGVAAFLVFRGVEIPRVYPTLPSADFYPPVPELAALPSGGEPYRVAGLGDAFVPNQSALYGLEDVRGYEAITNARLSETYPLWCVPQELWFNRVDDASRPFLSFLNARYLLVEPSAAAPPGWRERARGRSLAIFENPAVLPRAFAPARIRFVAGRSTVAEMQQYTSFAAVGWIEAPGETAREIANGPASVRTRGDGPDLVLDVDAAAPSWIIASETNWKGWRAREGETRFPIFFANHAFLGFRVGAGRHRVRLEYRPAAFAAALAVSAAAAAVLLGAAIRKRLTSRPAANPLDA